MKNDSPPGAAATASSPTCAAWPTCDEGYYEVQRRRKVGAVIDRLRMERPRQPQLLVEAAVTVVRHEFANLPPGVRLETGRITVEFQDPREALEKSLALAMAIRNDFAGFQRSTQ
jgi:hypothetical protein